MKITIIHGQNHKGSTYHIGKNLVNKIAPDEDIIEFFLPRDLNHFCVGCYNCIEDEKKCPYYDDKQKIKEAIEKSDILVFTTPTYCMRASAPMKSMMDLFFTNWMVHSPKKEMFYKKAVVISTAAGMGTKSAIKDVKSCLFYWGVPYIMTYGVSVQAMSWEGVDTDKKARIDSDISKLAEKLKYSSKPRIPLKTKFMFNIMRLMQKNNMGSSPVEKQYWQDNGWLDKNRPWKS